MTNASSIWILFFTYQKRQPSWRKPVYALLYLVRHVTCRNFCAMAWRFNLHLARIFWMFCENRRGKPAQVCMGSEIFCTDQIGVIATIDPTCESFGGVRIEKKSPIHFRPSNMSRIIVTVPLHECSPRQSRRSLKSQRSRWRCLLQFQCDSLRHVQSDMLHLTFDKNNICRVEHCNKNLSRWELKFWHWCIYLWWHSVNHRMRKCKVAVLALNVQLSLSTDVIFTLQETYILRLSLETPRRYLS